MDKVLACLGTTAKAMARVPVLGEYKCYDTGFIGHESKGTSYGCFASLVQCLSSGDNGSDIVFPPEAMDQVASLVQGTGSGNG